MSKRIRSGSWSWLQACAAILFGLSIGLPSWAQEGIWVTKTPMPTPRCCLGAGVLGDKLYAVGGGFGSFSALASVEVYDPGTNTWTTKAPIPTPRSSAGVATLDGLIYVVGGFSSLSGLTGTVEAYDPKTDTWSSKAPLPTARANLVVAAVGGTLYAIGGRKPGVVDIIYTTVEAYDPKN